MAAFAAGFVGSAMTIFAAAWAAGAVVRRLAAPWALVAALLLLTLAAVDVVSIRRRSYCVVGRWRQAKQSLPRTRSMTAVAFIWGADTGSAVTTFRVAALTWGALALTLLGFAPWWTGVAYGIAFAAPLLLALDARLTSGQLEQFLRLQRRIQAASALALAAAGGVLFFAA